MPSEGISIYFTVKDGASQVLKAIGDQTKSLDKETQRLEQSYKAMEKANEPLIKSQSELKSRLEVLKKQIADNRSEWKKYDSELAHTAMDDAIAEQDELKRQLKDVEDQIKSNSKSLSTYRESLRKASMDSSESGNALDDGSLGIGNLVAGLVASGAGSLLTNSLGGLAETFLSSEIGVPAASAISETISSAISGAAAGAALGPWGALAGAALGGISGAISGQTQIFGAEDDAFKSYYSELYENVNTGTSESITTGSDIAADRETDAISFATLFGGQEQAAAYLKSMVDMANRTPFLYEDLKSMSKTMKTYGWDTGEMIGDLTTIGDAGAALGMSSSDMNTVATALGRMQSSDKTSLEYLNMLTERGINAVGILAEARGRSVADTYSDISGGKIDGSDAVEIILAAMEKSFSGSMEDQSKTFSGLTSTLEGLREEIDNASGEGYNDLRGGGIQDEIDALGGPLGEALSKVAEVSGQNQAYLENLKEQYQREALSAVLLGEETTLFSAEDRAKLEEMASAFSEESEKYAEGNQEAGLKMESLKEEAEALAAAAYDSSEFVRQAQDVQLEQIEAIRENTSALTGWKNSFMEQQELSKGQGTGIDWGNVLSTAKNAWDLMGTNGATGGYAYGLNRVPYDGFPAILHQDERIKTAAEARAEDAGARAGGITLVFTGNSFYGVTEEMADQVMEIAARKLEQADIAAAPR